MPADDSSGDTQWTSKGNMHQLAAPICTEISGTIDFNSFFSRGASQLILHTLVTINHFITAYLEKPSRHTPHAMPVELSVFYKHCIHVSCLDLHSFTKLIMRLCNVRICLTKRLINHTERVLSGNESELRVVMWGKTLGIFTSWETIQTIHCVRKQACLFASVPLFS